MNLRSTIHLQFFILIICFGFDSIGQNITGNDAQIKKLINENDGVVAPLISLINKHEIYYSTLEIEIINLRNDKGLIVLELLDANNLSVKQIQSIIKDKACRVSVDSLQDVKYAVRFFHDENINRKLDTNWMGMPIEGFGFSNDACRMTGPKDFDEWLFDVHGLTRIKLNTFY